MGCYRNLCILLFVILLFASCSFEIDYTQSLADVTQDRIGSYNALVIYVTPDAYDVTMRGKKSSPEKARAFADLIDGPLAHLPSGRFAANSAWATCAAITHNLLRAAGTLTSPNHAVARGARLRRNLPAHWPWAHQWTALWANVFGPATGPPIAA